MCHCDAKMDPSSSLLFAFAFRKVCTTPLSWHVADSITIKAMRNNTIPAFLTLALISSCGELHINAFNIASTTYATKKRSLHRHVGISHIPEDLRQNPISTRLNKPLQTSTTLSPIQAALTKYAMISYIAHLCIALPMVLFPTYLKNKVMMTLGLQTKSASEHEALQVSQNCASTLMKLIPFVDIEISSPHMQDQEGDAEEDPVPTIWVSNHVSNLDTFIFLSCDEQLRGKNRRPVKAIYVSTTVLDVTFLRRQLCLYAITSLLSVERARFKPNMQASLFNGRFYPH